MATVRVRFPAGHAGFLAGEVYELDAVDAGDLIRLGLAVPAPAPEPRDHPEPKE